MRAGLLDRRVQIEHAVRTATPLGSTSVEWKPLLITWAGKQEPRGREVLAGGQVMPEVDAVFRIRWPSVPISTEMRVLDRDGTAYAITAMTQIGNYEGVEIYCKAAETVMRGG